MRGEEAQIINAKVGAELDRRGKSAIEGEGRRFADVGEHEGVGGLCQNQHAVLDCAPGTELERQVAPVASDQTDGERNDHRLLARLAGRCGHALRQVEAIGLRARIVAASGDDLGRAGLRVPEHELREVRARYIGEASHELLDGRRLAVVAGEIEVHAFAEILRAEQVGQHAHDLGPLLVDRRGIEVVDLTVDGGSHRMRERTGILDELVRAQAAHVADALDRARALIG